MPARVEIRWIGDNPAWVPILARWHVAEFADVLSGWQVEEAAFELRGHCARRAVPSTWVALEDDALLGSVSLLDSDRPAPDALAPWFATLFVDPAQRGRGIGAALSRAAVDQARDLGLSKLHLWTPRHTGFYSRLGWQSLGPRCFDGVDATLMRMDIVRAA